MKIISLVFLALFIFSGCSFKKESKDSTLPDLENSQKNSQTIKIYEKVYQGSLEDVEKALKEFSAKQLAEMTFDGASLIDIAIARGDSSIVLALLENGISPFSSNTKDGIKPYLKIHKLNEDVSKTLGAWIKYKWMNIFEKDDLKQISAELSQNQITCVDMLNLYSWYSQMSPTDLRYLTKFMEIVKSNNCNQEISASQISLVIKGEILGLLQNLDRSDEFLIFLSKNNHFKNARLKFKIDGGSIGIGPRNFIRITSTLDRFKDALKGQKFENLISFFDEERINNIEVYVGANQVLSENVSSFNSTKEKDLVQSALKLSNLHQSDGCFSDCDVIYRPSISNEP